MSHPPFPIFRLTGHIHHEIFSEKPANFLITLLYIAPVVIFMDFYKKIEMPIHQWSKICWTSVKGNVKFAVSHPTGNTFVRALLEELHKRSFECLLHNNRI